MEHNYELKRLQYFTKCHDFLKIILVLDVEYLMGSQGNLARTLKILEVAQLPLNVLCVIYNCSCGERDKSLVIFLGGEGGLIPTDKESIPSRSGKRVKTTLFASRILQFDLKYDFVSNQKAVCLRRTYWECKNYCIIFNASLTMIFCFLSVLWKAKTTMVWFKILTVLAQGKTSVNEQWI